MLTLVVCTKGRTTQLERLLTSLQAQRDRRFHVVVVDQNPPGFLAPSLAAGAGLSLTHMVNPPGVSRARNAGLAQVTTPFVAFPDDDCWYPPGLVADVIGRFAGDPALAVLTGRTVDAHFVESVSPHLAHSRRLSWHDVFHAGTTSAFFARTDAAKAAGGFDATLGVGAGTIYGAGEETEFLLKCIRHGFQVRYDRDLLVHHDQVAREPEKVASYAAGIGRVCRMHALGGTFLAPRIARAALKGAAMLASGNAHEARARWRWIRGVLKGYFAEPVGRSAQDDGGFGGAAAGVRHSRDEPRHG